MSSLFLGRSSTNQSLFASFLGTFSAKHGGAATSNCFESVTNGLTKQVVDVFWSETLWNDPPRQRIEAKIQIIGVTRFLAENPSEFDPRKFLSKTIDAMRDICIARYEAFNTAGNASKIRVKNLESMHLMYDAGELTPEVN